MGTRYTTSIFPPPIGGGNKRGVVLRVRRAYDTTEYGVTWGHMTPLKFNNLTILPSHFHTFILSP